MAWYVYVVVCADRTLYTGVTTDVARRLRNHNRGLGARYTAAEKRRPVTLAHCERAETLGAALRREAAIKRLPRAEKLRTLGIRLDPVPAVRP